MFIYEDNKQLKQEYKKILIENNITMTEVAKRMDILPQQLNNKFNNSRVSFADLKQWLNLIGYELQIDFVKKDIEL